MKENPLPRKLSRTDPGPMRDRTLFRTGTIIPRLPGSPQPIARYVSHRACKIVGMHMRGGVRVLFGMLTCSVSMIFSCISGNVNTTKHGY